MDRIERNPAPEWMVAALKHSQEQVAADDIVQLEPVLDRLRASIDRMKQRKTAKTAK